MASRTRRTRNVPIIYFLLLCSTFGFDSKPQMKNTDPILKCEESLIKGGNNEGNKSVTF